MDPSYDSPSYEKSRIPLLKGTEDYFSWSRVMKARLDRLEAWDPIESEPPVNHGRTKAPATLERFQEQFDQLGLDLDTTRYNQRQWDAAYVDYKDEIKEYNEWQKKEKMALSEIIERLSPTVLTRMNRYSTPKTLWEALEQAYAAPLITEQLRAFQDLMRIDRSAYPDVRRYTTAMNSAFNHLTHNLRFNLSPEFLSMHYLYKEASNPSSDWSKFLDKHRTGTVLDAPEDICTTLHGLEDQSSKVARKPAPAPSPSANILTGKRKRNDAQGGHQKQQKQGSTYSQCHKSHSLKEGQTCWLKNPEVAPEFWRKRHPELFKSTTHSQLSDGTKPTEDPQAEGAHGIAHASHAISSELPLAENQWTLVSGATHHCTPHRGLLSRFLQHAPITVSSADSSSESTGSGEFNLSLNGMNFTLKNVIYVPSIKVNILSTNRLLRDHKISYTNAAGHCLYKQSILLARADASNGLPVILTGYPQASYAESTHKPIYIHHSVVK
ncbi:hypothetical protein GJ744_011586 [Endocarpon pusillum]|uniref:Retrovirus-related Pol polyprotein from transposon TNT 1-94-like beta-barrel domain-containing protein n=1 Tax=Endocarpon pusillum TaxID=364733 RepID=A0A8H7AEM2_9EURO|nr:hypothetical protein GJ744_011586 [Endocarpon pusillum]